MGTEAIDADILLRQKMPLKSTVDERYARTHSLVGHDSLELPCAAG